MYDTLYCQHMHILPLYLFPQAGDVVGCMLDTAAGTISYTLNGAHLGTAFQLPAHEQQQHKGKGKRKANAEAVDTAVATTVGTAAYFPALSLEQGESVVINAGT
jgi:SPRY domain